MVNWNSEIKTSLQITWYRALQDTSRPENDIYIMPDTIELKITGCKWWNVSKKFPIKLMMFSFSGSRSTRINWKTDFQQINAIEICSINQKHAVPIYETNIFFLLCQYGSIIKNN